MRAPPDTPDADERALLLLDSPPLLLRSSWIYHDVPQQRRFHHGANARECHRLHHLHDPNDCHAAVEPERSHCPAAALEIVVVELVVDVDAAAAAAAAILPPHDAVAVDDVAVAVAVGDGDTHGDVGVIQSRGEHPLPSQRKKPAS